MMIKSPYPHQVEAKDFLIQKKRAILADEMGAGKTHAAILAMNALKGKRLIVCPASLKLNWQKEIRQVSNDPVLIIEGKKWGKVPKNAWVIMNYDILKNHIESIKKSKFKVVTFDEAHFAKSINNNGHGGSKRARYFIQVANLIDYVFLLTGTPITNKTKDVFNLLKAVKHPLSKNFKTFANRYCNPEFNGFGWSYDGASHQQELHERLQPFMMRRLKEDLLDLPEKTRTFLPVDVNVKEYELKVEEYMKKRGRLKERFEHLVYLNAMRHILAKEKTKHTIQLVQNLLEQHEPVVVFTNYTEVVERICEKFPHAVTVVGKNTLKERQQAVDDFQTGKTNLIVCNLVAGGTGITLTRAKNEIINDLNWNPADHIQAEERIYRIGQNNRVNIYYVYAEQTIDEYMTTLLEEKLLNINQIIDDKEEGFLNEVILSFEKNKKV